MFEIYFFQMGTCCYSTYDISDKKKYWQIGNMGFLQGMIDFLEWSCFNETIWYGAKWSLKNKKSVGRGTLKSPVGIPFLGLNLFGIGSMCIHIKQCSSGKSRHFFRWGGWKSKCTIAAPFTERLWDKKALFNIRQYLVIFSLPKTFKSVPFI